MNKPIVVKDLVKTYGSIVAVNDVSFEVEKGEVVALLGPNGAGKTTMVRLLGGIIQPDSGSMEVLGFSGKPLEVKKRIGVLTETFSLYERMTARDNLRFFAELHSIPKDMVTSRIEEVLALLGLSDRANDKVFKFSKGMKKRLSLARSILNNPKLLFLDEPISDLDPVGAMEIQEHIQKLSSENKTTIVICSHNLHMAEQISDRFIVMKQGRFLLDGNIKDLLSKGKSLENVYIDLMRREK